MILTTIELPKELDEQIASHHWSKQLWDLLVELKCLPIMDYEYENDFDVTDERKNFVFNVQKRKMLREDIDDTHFVLSSCCYTTFVVPNGVLEEQRIKKFFDEFSWPRLIAISSDSVKDSLESVLASSSS